MAIYPTVKLSNLPRMADFMTWGAAISQALGYQADDFINAYQKNIEVQNSEIINSNTLAQAVLMFIQDKESWDGTVRQAYEELEKLVTVSKEDKTFPKHLNKLRGHLNRIKANLMDYGVKFTFTDFNNHRRGCSLSFQKIAKVSSVCSASSVPYKDGGFQWSIQRSIPGVSSAVSSAPNPSKIKPTEHAEDAEHQIQPFWKEKEEEKSQDAVLNEPINLDALGVEL